MANLQIQDSFEPYYAGRDAEGWQGDANVNKPSAQQADQNPPQRRRQLELASRRLAVLARRQGLREK